MIVMVTVACRVCRHFAELKVSMVLTGETFERELFYMERLGMLAKKMTCLAALIALAPQAYANYFSTGTVDLVSIYPSNGVVIVSSAGLSYAYLCQIGGTYNGIGS